MPWQQRDSGIEEDEMPWGEEAVEANPNEAVEVDGIDWDTAQGWPSMAGVGRGRHTVYHDDVQLENGSQQNEYSNISVGAPLCLSTT